MESPIKNNPQKARELLEDTLKRNPRNYVAHYGLADILDEFFNDLEGAQMHYKASLEINPKCEEAHNNYAFFLSSKCDDYVNAKMHYEAAIAINPQYAEAHNNYAFLLKTKLNDEEGAKIHYLKAIEINPSIRTKSRDDFYGIDVVSEKNNKAKFFCKSDVIQFHNMCVQFAERGATIREVKEYIDREGVKIFDGNKENPYIWKSLCVAAALIRAYESSISWGQKLFNDFKDIGEEASRLIWESGLRAYEAGEYLQASMLFRVAHNIDSEDFNAIENELNCFDKLAEQKIEFSITRCILSSRKFIEKASDVPEKALRVMSEKQRLQDLIDKSPEPSFYGAFICHAHANYDKVVEILDIVNQKKRPIRWFMSQNSLEPGVPWKPQIENAIRTNCDLMILFHSTEIKDRTAVKDEWEEGQKYLSSSRLVVVDFDNSYMPKSNEFVVSFTDPEQVASTLISHICKLEHRTENDTPKLEFFPLPRLSVDIVGTKADVKAAQGIRTFLEQCGIAVLTDTLVDEEFPHVSNFLLPADATLCILSEDSYKNNNWRTCVQDIYISRGSMVNGSLILVCVDSVEANIKDDPWKELHFLSLNRFLNWTSLLSTLASKLRCESFIKNIPELPFDLKDLSLPPLAKVVNTPTNIFKIKRANNNDLVISYDDKRYTLSSVMIGDLEREKLFLNSSSLIIYETSNIQSAMSVLFCSAINLHPNIGFEISFVPNSMSNLSRYNNELNKIITLVSEIQAKVFQMIQKGMNNDMDIIDKYKLLQDNLNGIADYIDPDIDCTINNSTAVEDSIGKFKYKFINLFKKQHVNQNYETNVIGFIKNNIKHCSLLELTDFNLLINHLSQQRNKILNIASNISYQIKSNMISIEYFNRAYTNLLFTLDPNFNTLALSLAPRFTETQAKGACVLDEFSHYDYIGHILYCDDSDPDNYCLGAYARVKNPLFNYFAPKGSERNSNYLWVFAETFYKKIKYSYWPLWGMRTINNFPSDEGFRKGLIDINLPDYNNIVLKSSEYYYVDSNAINTPNYYPLHKKYNTRIDILYSNGLDYPRANVLPYSKHKMLINLDLTFNEIIEIVAMIKREHPNHHYIRF